MNKKILVIFLFAVIMIRIIYYFNNKEINNALIIGEEIVNIDASKYKVKTFLYDNITYKELIKSIKNNDYIVVKEKKVYLTELISNSKYIVITANKSYCKKHRLLDNRSNNDLNYLISIIKRISIGEVIVINYCNNRAKEINVNNMLKYNNT